MDKLCKIRDIQRAVATFESRFETRYGICLNEGMALCSLRKVETLTAGAIGEMLGLSLSNTSKVLASAEKKGLVVRDTGTKDRRQVYYSLTANGEALISSVRCEQVDTPQILEELL